MLLRIPREILSKHMISVFFPTFAISIWCGFGKNILRLSLRQRWHVTIPCLVLDSDAVML